MLGKNITKNGKGSIGPLPQSKQSSIIPFPGVSPSDDTPLPKPAAKIELWPALCAVNPNIDSGYFMSLMYTGVLGYDPYEIKEMLSVPDHEVWPVNYLPTLARTYLALAFEMSRIEVERINRAMSLEEIYALIEKNAALAGNQARMAERMMRIDLITGEPLERQ